MSPGGPLGWESWSFVDGHSTCKNVPLGTDRKPRRADVRAVELLGRAEALKLELHRDGETWPRIFRDHWKRIAEALAPVEVEIVFVGIALSLTSYDTEYHDNNSGVDGTPWRQIAALEDPLSRSLYLPWANEPDAYLDALPCGDALPCAEVLDG